MTKDTNGNIQNRTSSKTTKLVIAALFAALSLALKPFEIYLLPVARLSFVPVPVLVSGMVLGPVWGAAVGLIADLAGFIFMDKSGMAINPILILGNVLLGAIPGLIFHLSKKIKIKDLTFNLLNIGNYVVLVVLCMILLMCGDFLQLQDGVFQILSPTSEEFVPLPMSAILLIASGFIIYSMFITFLLRKIRNKQERSRDVLAQVLFSVSLAVIISHMTLNTIGLSLQYGWPLSVMLVIKLVQGFCTIPVFTLVAYVILKAARRFKV